MFDFRYVEMVHGQLDSATVAAVVEEFVKEDSEIKLVIATMKMGMGVNIKALGIVVIFGLGSSIVDTWQKVGRCQRSGEGHGLALLYATAQSLADTKAHIRSTKRSGNPACLDPYIKEIHEANLKNICHRDMLLKAFSLSSCNPINLQYSHDCNEESGCKCKSCMCCPYCRYSKIEDTISYFLSL